MLETLLEVQRLKRLERTGWMLRGIAAGAESVAAHSFGVCAVAMMLADAVVARGVHVNGERVLRLGLVHDWAEARLGDMPRTASLYFDARAKQHAERAAFADIVGPLEQRAAYEALHEEYEARESLEARLVKAADVVDLLLQVLAFERAGVRGLDEFWAGAASYDFQLNGAAGEVVAAVMRQLIAAHANAAAS